jgi:hypothetical protein
VLVHVPTTEHGLAHPTSTRRPHAPFWPAHTDALVFTTAPAPTVITPRGPKDHAPAIALDGDESRIVATAQPEARRPPVPEAGLTATVGPVDPPTTPVLLPPTPAAASTTGPPAPVRPSAGLVPNSMGVGLLLSGLRRGARPIGSGRTSTSGVSR